MTNAILMFFFCDLLAYKYLFLSYKATMIIVCRAFAAEKLFENICRYT